MTALTVVVQLVLVLAMAGLIILVVDLALATIADRRMDRSYEDALRRGNAMEALERLYQANDATRK